MAAHVFFVEGGDGAGKTTTVSDLAEAFRRKNDVVPCNIMKFTEVGKLIYDIDCFEGLNNIEQFCARLFAVFYNIEKIMQHSSPSDIVICDRHFASTFAYQIASSTMDAQIKNAMMVLFTKLVDDFDKKYKGKFTEIFLDIDYQTANERMLSSRDQLDVIESKPGEYHKSVNEAYKLFFSKRRDVLTYNTGLTSTETIVESVLRYAEKNNDFKQT